MPSEYTLLDQPVSETRPWVIQWNIGQLESAIQKVYTLRKIYFSMIEKIWIPQPIGQNSEKSCGVGGAHIEPRWLVQISVMLQDLNELLKESIHDLWYIEDNL